MLRFSSWRRAGIIACGYAAAALAYIYLSSAWVGALGLDPPEQARLEVLKGFGFVAVTGLLLLFLMAGQFRKLRAARDALVAQTHALGRAERRATMATVSAALAHDMKNQLMVSLASYAILADAPLGGEAAEARQDLGESLARLREMSRDLMKRSAGEHGRVEPVDVSRVARRMARMARFCAARLERELVVRAGDGCIVRADERDLEHATLNLILNAVEATGGRGQVRVEVGTEEGRVVLSVCDDGPGVPDELREKVFEPFFTTKAEGTGLGLATVRQVVERLQGDVVVVPGRPRGACFRIGLPVDPRAASGGG